MFNMELADWIRSLAFVVSFCILVAVDRKTWLFGDALIVTGFGTSLLIYPTPVVGYEVEGEIGDMHVKISRILGAVLLSSALLIFLSRETRDGTVPISIMTSRVFCCGVTLLSQVYTYYLRPKSAKSLNWNEQFAHSGMLATFTWLLGNLIHMMQSHDFNTYPQFQVRINTHLRFDAFVVGIGALFFFAFPDAAIHSVIDGGKLDRVHLHLSRLIGVHLLASALVSMQAGGFLHEHDKRHHFLTRIVGLVSICAVLVFFDLQEGVFSKDKWMTISLLIFIPLINAIFGYFSEGTMFYRTSTKTD